MNNEQNKKNAFCITSERDFSILKHFIERGLSPLDISPEVRSIAVDESLRYITPYVHNYLNGSGGTSNFTCFIERELPECTVSIMLTKYSAFGNNPVIKLMYGRLRSRFFKIVIQRNLFFKRSVRLAVSITK